VGPDVQKKAAFLSEASTDAFQHLHSEVVGLRARDEAVHSV
jgi:hypothetical protein